MKKKKGFRGQSVKTLGSPAQELATILWSGGVQEMLSLELLCELTGEAVSFICSIHMAECTLQFLGMFTK